MAKFFQRMGSKKETYLVLLKLLSLEISVTEHIDRISIEWKRGEKTSCTQPHFELTPQKHVTAINETFSKTSVFYFAPKSQTYFKKVAMIRVRGFTHGSSKQRELGEVELDLAPLVGA
jgi:hypothetical protein